MNMIEICILNDDGRVLHKFVRRGVIDMATAIKNQAPIDKANEKKRLAIDALNRAAIELCEAQNQITYVEGNGSADIYDAIATTYQDVAKLRRRLNEMKSTGFFE